MISPWGFCLAIYFRDYTLYYSRFPRLYSIMNVRCYEKLSMTFRPARSAKMKGLADAWPVSLSTPRVLVTEKYHSEDQSEPASTLLLRPNHSPAYLLALKLHQNQHLAPHLEARQRSLRDAVPHAKKIRFRLAERLLLSRISHRTPLITRWARWLGW
jgi:hypothetical protein